MIEINFWIVLGLAAQLIFFFRFFLQWVVSERKGESTIPIGFWYLSLIGGIGLLTYAIHIRDPIFIIGQTTGVFIYVRNLMLIYKKK